MTTALASYTGTSAMDGIFRRVYGDEVVRAVPETDKIAKDLPFVSEEKREGDTFNIPVQLTQETGFTFNTDGSVFTLNQPISNVDKNAQVSGAEFVLRSAISYAAMQKALKSGDSKASARAFVNATKDKVQAMISGASFAREVQLIYGGGTAAASNLGVVSATTGSAGTSLVVTFTDASWCHGLWAGKENMECAIFSSGGTDRSTAGTAAAGDNVFKVTTVDADNKKVTFVSHATNVGNVVAADQIFFQGARTKEMMGIDAMLATSGTVWGISNSTYNLWKGSSYTVSGQLTFEAVLSGLRRPAALGYNGKMVLYTSTRSWQDLNNDQAALVRHVKDKVGGEMTMGSESIRYYGQTGELEIKPHILIKDGESFALPVDDCMRVGATDTTFEMPDGQGKIFRHLEDKAGLEIRCYWLQAFFTKRPAFCVKYSGIVPAA
jgi:hypothetical protein